MNKLKSFKNCALASGIVFMILATSFLCLRTKDHESSKEVLPGIFLSWSSSVRRWSWQAQLGLFAPDFVTFTQNSLDNAILEEMPSLCDASQITVCHVGAVEEIESTARLGKCFPQIETLHIQPGVLVRGDKDAWEFFPNLKQLILSGDESLHLEAASQFRAYGVSVVSNGSEIRERSNESEEAE